MNSKAEKLEENFQLDDNREGFKTLIKELERIKKEHNLKKILVGLESTGGYENNWYIGLRRKSEDLGLEVYRINPKRIYYETKSEGRRSTNDSISAEVIAGYMIKNEGKRDLSPKRLADVDEQTESLLRLHKYIQALIKQNTQTKNRLEKILYQSLPELLSFKGDKYPKWFLELLIKYPSKDCILRADTEGISKIRGITNQKAQAIMSAVQDTVGSLQDPYDTLLISEQAQDIQRLEAKIKRLKDQLVELSKIKHESNISYTTSIRGISDDSAVGIILEFGDISRFRKSKSLVAYLGINPTIKQSGDKQLYIGISKDGSPNARAVLYQAARNVVLHEPYFKSIYQKHLKRGKSHNSAIVIIMAKLTRVIYGMLKNQQNFDPGIDFLNQNKTPKNQKSKSENHENKSKRRYQKPNENAPISRRQKTKRKQEIVPS